MSSGNSSLPEDAAAKLAEPIRRMHEHMKKEFQGQRDQNAKFAPRILLVGPSGVGKSSLVNTIFGLGEREQATVRAGGTPCTQQFSEYGPFERVPVKIIDSRGIERDDGDEGRDAIVEYVREKNNEGEAENHVHMAWYMPDKRWESSDKEYVKMLREVVEVVVVLTKCDERQQIDPDTGKTGLELTRDVIQEAVPGIPIVNCAIPPADSTHWAPERCPKGHLKKEFLISMRRGTWHCEAEEVGEPCDEKGRGKPGPYGLIELIEMTIERIPELFRKSLIAAQVVAMKRKHMLAAAAISTATAAAMGVGAIPIPFSDLPFLLGIEVVMSAAIFTIYDVNSSVVSPETWVKLNTAVVGIAGTIGSVAANFMKITLLLAPLGSVIDATIAGVVVATLGYTLAAVCASLPPRWEGGSAQQGNFAAQLFSTLESAQVGSIIWPMIQSLPRVFRSGDNEQLNTQFVELIENSHD